MFQYGAGLIYTLNSGQGKVSDRVITTLPLITALRSLVVTAMISLQEIVTVMSHIKVLPTSLFRVNTTSFEIICNEVL